MEGSNELYSVSLDGDGVSINKKIDVDTARRVMNVLLGGSASGFGYSPDRARARQHREGGALDSSVSINKVPATSLREYLDEVDANRNPDKILAIASFIINMQGVEDFGSDDIKPYFAKAGEVIPANYSRDFNLVVGSGWIAEHHQNPGRYYITNTGTKVLAEKFPKETLKPRRVKIKKKKSNKEQK